MKRATRRLKSIVNRLSAGNADQERIMNGLEATTARKQVDRTDQGSVARASVKAKDLRASLRKHMAAAAFAEAGEFESAYEIIERITKPRSVLLVVDGETPDTKTFEYALGLCTRENLELDILQVIERSASEADYEALSNRFAEGSRRLLMLVQRLEQAQIPFKITVRLGTAHEKLVNYARRHKDVSVVVLDSSKARSSSSPGKALERLTEGLSRHLSIPLVTVLDRSPA